MDFFWGDRDSMPDCADGDLVEVVSSKGDYLATGYYHDGSIAIRILSFKRRVRLMSDFWKEKLGWAFDSKTIVLGLPNEVTNAFRLIHGEGDGLSRLDHRHLWGYRSHTVSFDRYAHHARNDCQQHWMIVSPISAYRPFMTRVTAALPKDYAGIVEDGPHQR